MDAGDPVRAEDERALSDPLPDGRGTDVEEEIARRLGVYCPNVASLEDEIHGDLADGPPFGIRWWRESSGGDRARRILLAGHLCACVRTLVYHLTAARLSWSDFVEARDEENAVFGQLAEVKEDGMVRFSRAESPVKSLDFAEMRARLREDGIVLSLHSALDCLAAVAAIVASLPVDARTASFPGVRKRLQEIASKSRRERELERLQAMTSKHLEAAIQCAGPVDWIEWLRGYRNMMVHRGRPQAHASLRPASGIVRPDGTPARWKTVAHLPKYPELSDVETLLVSARFGECLWQGDSHAVLRRLIERVTTIVDRTAGTLLDVWQRRRACPEAAFLEPEQWRPATVRIRGGGSAADEGVDVVSARSCLPMKRWRAAAITDEHRSVWEEADMRPFIPEWIRRET